MIISIKLLRLLIDIVNWFESAYFSYMDCKIDQSSFNVKIYIFNGSLKSHM
jgi:hypothetical protein